MEKLSSFKSPEQKKPEAPPESSEKREASPREKRSLYREFFREYLPLDLQLQFEKKGRWHFKDSLLARRHSEIPEDKLFFEILKQKQGESSEEPDFSYLEEQKSEERKKITSALEMDSMVYGVRQQLESEEGSWTLLWAGKIAAAMGDKKEAKKIEQKLVKMNHWQTAIEVAIAAEDWPTARRFLVPRSRHPISIEITLMKELAEKYPNPDQKLVKEMTVNGWEGAAGIVAARLGDAKTAWQIAEKSMTKGKWATDLFLDEWGVSMATILAEKNPETSKKIMDRALALVFVASGKANLKAAGEIALALAPKEPAAAKEVMQKLLRLGSETTAGKIALVLGDLKTAEECLDRLINKNLLEATKLSLAMADKDPKAVEKTMKRLIKESDYYNAGKLAVALGDQKTGQKIIKKLFKIKEPGKAGKIAVDLRDFAACQKAIEELREDNPEEAAEIACQLAKLSPAAPEVGRFKDSLFTLAPDKPYLVGLASRLLTTGRSLSEIPLNYLPGLRALKDYGKNINAQIDKTKKWKKPDVFFQKNAQAIGNLQALDLPLSNRLLHSLFSRGLSFAEAALKIYEPVLSSRGAWQAVSDFMNSLKKPLRPNELGMLLETVSAYINNDEEAVFVDMLKGADYLSVQNQLNRGLLEVVAKKLKISATINRADLDQWHLRFLPNLITNQTLLEGDFEYNSELKLYRSLIKATLENRFADFIGNSQQEDELGRRIARHNQRVRAAFEESGINWQEWENFSGQAGFEISAYQKTEPETSFAKLEERLLAWQKSLANSPLESSVQKDIANLKRQKTGYKVDFDDPEWSRKLLPAYHSSLNYLQRKKEGFELSPESINSFDQLLEIVQVVGTSLPEEQVVKKEFIVKRWDRDPRRDLFQGNFTHCCISVGVKDSPLGGHGMFHTVYPATILQYLIDKGIQVAEVVNPESGEPIGQCWLFVSLDKDKQPVLVADNFEMNRRYPIGSHINNGARGAMFEFLKQYARAAGIKTAVLGDVSSNDVKTSDLKLINFGGDKKLGGYFQGKEYYLEALHKALHKDDARLIFSDQER